MYIGVSDCNISFERCVVEVVDEVGLLQDPLDFANLTLFRFTGPPVAESPRGKDNEKEGERDLVRITHSLQLSAFFSTSSLSK
jgi:hypothetical protein